MGSSKSKPAEPHLTEQQLSQANRKCAAFLKGLQSCRRANPGDPAACKNLEMRVVTCYGEDHCKEEADEHRKCYTKLYKTGIYKGLGHCIKYEEAMKSALKKLGLYPIQ